MRLLLAGAVLSTALVAPWNTWTGGGSTTPTTTIGTTTETVCYAGRINVSHLARHPHRPHHRRHCR